MLWHVAKRRLLARQHKSSLFSRLFWPLTRADKKHNGSESGHGHEHEHVAPAQGKEKVVMRTMMRRIKRLMLIAAFANVAKRLISRKVGGAEGAKMMLMETMPKMMDRAFSKLEPSKRQEMLGRCHAVLTGLDEKYGTETEAVEEPAELIAA